VEQEFAERNVVRSYSVGVTLLQLEIFEEWKGGQQ
jgi:hypothetical protein